MLEGKDLRGVGQ